MKKLRFPTVSPIWYVSKSSETKQIWLIGTRKRWQASFLLNTSVDYARLPSALCWRGYYVHRGLLLARPGMKAPKTAGPREIAAALIAVMLSSPVHWLCDHHLAENFLWSAIYERPAVSGSFHS